jgi:hypothetical protein
MCQHVSAWHLTAGVRRRRCASNPLAGPARMLSDQSQSQPQLQQPPLPAYPGQACSIGSLPNRQSRGITFSAAMLYVLPNLTVQAAMPMLAALRQLVLQVVFSRLYCISMQPRRPRFALPPLLVSARRCSGSWQ